jgi:hypothetical protein
LNCIDEDLRTVHVTERRHLRERHSKPRLVLHCAHRDDPDPPVEKHFELGEALEGRALKPIERQPTKL